MKAYAKLLLYANAGVFVDGYIIGSIGLALITLTTKFHLSPTDTGLVGAATLFGILVGAPLFGHLADRHGRRVLMILDLAAFVIVAILQVFIANTWELIALRFVLGVAIGADYPIAMAIVAEFMPDNRRGAALNLLEATWFVGAAVAYVAGYALLGTGPDSWKWILASPALFALVGLALRTAAPETPKWVASRDSGELQQASFSKIFEPPYGSRIAFVSAMWLLQVVPLFAIYTFAPAVLSALGLTNQSSPAGSVAITAAFAIGSFASIPLVERWGRRALCIAGFGVSVVAFAFIAIGNPTVVLICFVAYAIGSGASSGLELIYPAELFPTSIRASAGGFAAAVSRIGAFAGTFALPVALARFGIVPIVVVSAALSAVGLIISWLWAPETKGQALL
ncbi:MAG TPA: MFS transporter [Candidatus Cybelea sp.]|nr:MFS transporter [Candidatus Cybelea sp.]